MKRYRIASFAVDGRAVGLAPARRIRRARTSVTSAFALAGFLMGVFTARIPALVDKLAISTVQLGTMLFVWGLAGVATMQMLRYVMARVGSATVLRIAAPVYAGVVGLVASAPTYGLALTAVAAFGLAFGAVEVSAKSQGSEVERRYGRPVMNGMHAGWPVGAGVGGLAAALCAHLGVSYTWCLGGAALAALPLAFGLGGSLLAVAPVAVGARVGRRARVAPVVYLFGLLACAALVLEGAVTDWSGVLLHGTVGSSHAVAALAYPVFQAGMLTGRLGSDRLRVALGTRRLVMAAGLATAVGLLVATAVPRSLAVLVGVYVAGVGISPLLPLTVSMAGAGDRERGDAAIAQLSVIGYGGLLAGPAVIAALADAAGLRVALASVALLSASTIIAAARFLPTAKPASPKRADGNRSRQQSTTGGRPRTPSARRRSVAVDLSG